MNDSTTEPAPPPVPAVRRWMCCHCGGGGLDAHGITCTHCDGLGNC